MDKWYTILNLPKHRLSITNHSLKNLDRMPSKYMRFWILSWFRELFSEAYKKWSLRVSDMSRNQNKMKRYTLQYKWNRIVYWAQSKGCKSKTIITYYYNKKHDK